MGLPPTNNESKASTYRDNRLLAIVATVFYLAVSPAAAEETSTQCLESEESWLDSSHCHIVSGADNIAGWMNNFFGDVRTEEEAPYSTLRLRFDQEWSQDNQFDSDVKLRGKVYLPSLNRRLSLLFSEEDSEAIGNDDQLIDQRDTPDDVTLQYNATEEEHSRLDFRVGLRSSLSPKASVRYKYEYPIEESLIATFSEELLYRGDDGFGSKTRFEFDKILAEDKLLQWHNKVDWEEDTSGVQWGTSLSWDKRLSEKKAYGYFATMIGRTEPEDIINTYAIGVRYRQNIFRPWLFAEIQPSYRWHKPEPGLPREDAAVILLRLEAVFRRDLNKSKSSKSKKESNEKSYGGNVPDR